MDTESQTRAVKKLDVPNANASIGACIKTLKVLVLLLSGRSTALLVLFMPNQKRFLVNNLNSSQDWREIRGQKIRKTF